MHLQKQMKKKPSKYLCKQGIRVAIFVNNSNSSYLVSNGVYMNYMELQVIPESRRFDFCTETKAMFGVGCTKINLSVNASNEKKKANKNLVPLNVCSDGECQ